VVPVNTDPVGCSPLYEIRETQSATAPINQFANAGSNGQYAGRGQSFSLVNSQVTLDTQPPQGFVPSQQNRPMVLPSRDRASNSDRFSSTGFSLPDDNEMDISTEPSVDQASPATSNSRSKGGSTSHTSGSPAQQQNYTAGPQYRMSPRDFSNTPLPQTTGGDANSFFSASDDMFNAVFGQGGASMLGDGLSSNNFMMANDWDPNALNAGMTPMSEGGWNQLIEGMNLGWEGGVPPHGEGTPFQNQK
jgi:hypothetical protein